MSYEVTGQGHPLVGRIVKPTPGILSFGDRRTGRIMEVYDADTLRPIAEVEWDLPEDNWPCEHYPLGHLTEAAAFKIGDPVLLSVGSWYNGRYVEDDREVKGRVLGIGEDYIDSGPVVKIHVEELQRPNGAKYGGIVERFQHALKAIEKEG